MSDDGVIRIGTEVDVSRLKAGMAEAASMVKSSTSQMESAYALLAQATVDYAAKTAVLRDGIRQLVTGAIPYTESQKVLVPILKEQAAASDALRAAKASLTLTETAETEAVKSNISARMAATAELRVFEGNVMGSTRAAGAFLSLLPGIGAAMQAAFPVFGALALAGVVVDLGEKMAKAFDIGGERARATQQAIRDVRQEIDRSTTSLNVQIDRLQQEQAKLELKPFNGLKLTLDEAAEAAQELADRLDSIVEKESKAIAGMSGSIPQQLLGQSGSTKYEQTMLSEHAKWIGLAKTQQDQLNESTSYGNSLLTRQKELEAWIKDAGTSPATVAGYKTELDAIQQMISWQQQEQENIKTTIALKTQEAATQKARDAHGDQSIVNKAMEARRKAEEAAIQAARQHLDELKAIHQLSAASEAAYWEGLAATAKRGSLEYTALMDEANKAAARANKPNAEWLDQWQQQQKLLEDQVASQRRAQEALDAYNLAVADSAARVREAQDKASDGLSLANVRASEASGGMGKLAAAQETARIHAKEYADELARLDEQIKNVQADSSLTPAQQQQKLGQLQSQKITVQGQAQATGISDQAAIQQQIANPYLQAFNQIDQSWLQVQNRMFYSTRNLSLEFAKMGQSILISIVDSFEKAALVAIEKELVMTIAHRTAVAQRVATDATGATQSEAIASTSLFKKIALEVWGLFHHTATNTAKVASDATSSAAGTAAVIPANIAQAMSFAAVAGAAATASAAMIPFVGWTIAPAAGAAAFATGAGFASMAAFEDGTGYVPRDGMAYLHEGEAVVPAPTVQELRGSDGGGDVHIHQANNWSTMTDREFRRQLDRHADQVAYAVKKHVRQGGKG